MVHHCAPLQLLTVHPELTCLSNLRDLESARHPVLEHSCRIVLGSRITHLLDILRAICRQRILRAIAVIEISKLNTQVAKFAVFARARLCKRLDLIDAGLEDRERGLLELNGGHLDRGNHEDAVVLEMLGAEHVATPSDGVLGKGRAERLHDHIHSEVPVWYQDLDLIDQFFVDLGGFLDDFAVVVKLEGQREPDVPWLGQYADDALLACDTHCWPDGNKKPPIFSDTVFTCMSAGTFRSMDRNF